MCVVFYTCFNSMFSLFDVFILVSAITRINQRFLSLIVGLFYAASSTSSKTVKFR